MRGDAVLLVLLAGTVGVSTITDTAGRGEPGREEEREGRSDGIVARKEGRLLLVVAEVHLQSQ